MKAEGRGSATPIRNTFFKYPNNKYALLALFGATMDQGVVWYTAQFYALFFINGPLKADWWVGYTVVGVAVLLATPLFVFFGRLSDKIGRLTIILAGCALATICNLPTIGMSLFHLLARSINPELAAFNDTRPARCHFTIFPVKGWTTEGDCDKGKAILTSNGISFTSVNGAAGSKVTLAAGDAKVEGTSPYAWQRALAESLGRKPWQKALADVGYPHFKVVEADLKLTKEQADGLTDATATLHVSEIKTTTAKALSFAQYVQSILIVFAMMLFTTMVYGPIAAFLVEMFPSNVRYTSMSLPNHIGNGWFGGMLPFFATAYVAYTGNIFAGLLYPVVFAAITAVVGFLFLKETKDIDIAKN